MKRILIVESGATKTDWCAIGGGCAAERLQTPGMNLSSISAEANASVFADAVKQFSGVEEVHFYAAGLLEFPVELDRVFRERFPKARCEYASDLVAAARAACGHAPGIAAILGTGSNTCQYDGEKMVRNIHGGGFIIGDEGSAAALGRMFLADLVKDLVPEDLAEAFSAFHEADYASVVRNVYKSPAPSRYLGSLAPFLLEHRGDAYVDALIDRNFRNLIERTLVRYDRLPVGVVGGFGGACRAELERLGAEYGLTFSRFIPSPMEGLIDYHGV
jgi:N-acetylglucosamine kinase-like BadF-type ATPase